jgi:ADP-ribose pyrophosphatase YjhB (NUDIX family)
VTSDGDGAPRLRPAVRGLVLDERDRVLLVRFDLPAITVWATPGGGIEAGETVRQALARELVEDVGLVGAEIGPALWRRRHVTAAINGWDGQDETVFLVRVRAFTVAPAFTADQLAAEGLGGHRWWTAAELAADTTSTFAPRRLPALVTALLTDGPPAVPAEIGV